MMNQQEWLGGLIERTCLDGQKSRTLVPGYYLISFMTLGSQFASLVLSYFFL